MTFEAHAYIGAQEHVQTVTHTHAHTHMRGFSHNWLRTGAKQEMLLFRHHHITTIFQIPICTTSFQVQYSLPISSVVLGTLYHFMIQIAKLSVFLQLLW